ncbi:MAG TPA: hypothetical protein VHZ07_01765 [Bryobacteraceae bacterium]|jgi:hypothetical protein|nr:hypothetical protein [Bryobacteraceae bacterium]
MTPTPLNRKARRAAERAEHKAARKGLEHHSSEPELCTPPAPLPEPRPSGSGLTPARLAANRANAQLSTGPKSESGKANSSKNAKDEAAFLSEPKIQQVTALTGRTVLLPEDDADRYENHLNQYKKAYQPVGERECELVQSLADTTWRLDRIPGLEEAIYARGCTEFAAEVSDLDPRSRSASLHMRTYLAYERQLRNLNLQEMRLHRLREKLTAEIKQLQKEREQKEKDDLAIAAKLYVAAKHDRKPFNPADFGFEFSTTDLEGYLYGQRAAFLTEKAMIGGQRD